MIGNDENDDTSTQIDATMMTPAATPAPSVCKSTKYWRRPVACKICKRPSFYSYYSVRCCEGCKQFFRRIVVGQKEYWCKHDRMCSMKNGDHCLACRLDRCLLAGMQPHLVNVVPTDEKWQEFVDRLEKRRIEIQSYQRQVKQQFEKGNFVEEDDAGEDGFGGYMIGRERALVNLKDWQQLNLLLMLENRQKRIWDVTTDLPPGLEQFQSIQELLQFPGHILTPPKKLPVRRGKLDEEFTEKYPSGQEVLNFICIDSLLLLEWIRSMPTFTDLDLNDQLALLKQIQVPFTSMCNAFYATLINAEHKGLGTWTRPNNVVFHRSELIKDERLCYLSEKVFCKSVDVIQSLRIGQEEFVLMLAILCCTSTASETHSGRERLYTQSAEYCRILMTFLQQRDGPEPGARKYAQCMHVLEEMYRMKHTYEMFNAYFAMCVFMKPELQRKQLEMEEFPKALALFCPFSTS